MSDFYLDGEELDLVQFFRDNDDDSLSEEERSAILALEPGESLTLGGGAVPLRTVSRRSISEADGVALIGLIYSDDKPDGEDRGLTPEQIDAGWQRFLAQARRGSRDWGYH